MDTATFEKTKDGFLEKTEKISSWDGTGLYLSRDYPDVSPKAIMIILHGLANHLSLYAGKEQQALRERYGTGGI